MNLAFNIRRVIVTILVVIVLMNQSLVEAQNLKPMDRKKWKELVEEVKNRRYDPREKPNQYNEEQNDNFYKGDSEGSDEESEYSNSYSDQNIYSSEDREFFDESNDGNGPGGNDEWGNPNSEMDPRYMDEDEGFSTQPSNQSGSDGGTYRSTPQETRPIQSRTSTSSSSSSGGGGDASWLLWVLVGVLAAALIYMILVSFKDNKKTKVVESVESKFENLTISKSELELALEAALKDKNYREAVRIYFIATIKEMKDRSWIKWEKKKTNHHYINEISGRQQQPDFITATRAFEIVWYGNRDLALNEYNQIEPVFKKLIQSIN